MTDRIPARTLRQVLVQWPDTLAAAVDNPDDDNLQKLCTLLDGADNDVCRRWGATGHDDRRAALASLRADARHLAGIVRETSRRARSEAGRANAAKRRPRP